MNPGLQLILLVVGTVGAAIAVVHYRDLIFVDSQPAGRRRSGPARQSRRHLSPRRPALASSQAKPAAKPAATISMPVSGYVMQENDAEMIAYFAIAKLIQAKMITETAALATVFNVKPGNSQAYKEARSKLKRAQSQLDSSTVSAA